MGPITLFDKSFLQSLSLDEAVIFDVFFKAVICPSFWVETLADLEKHVREGRTPEQEVGIIADKTPELNSELCAHSFGLTVGALLTDLVPVDGRIPKPGGRKAKLGDGYAIRFEPSPEELAFQRWQERRFLEVERQFAKRWREHLKSIDIRAVKDGLEAMGVSTSSFKTEHAAYSAAVQFVSSTDCPSDRLNLLLLTLGLPSEFEKKIYDRWMSGGCKPMPEYSPYAAHAFSVSVFFHLAVCSGLLKTSDIMDVSYLLYLPFCMVFVSSDKLHKRIAPLFMRPNQSLVWGKDLKTDLSLNVVRLKARPETEAADMGLVGVTPPEEGNGLITSLWDEHLLPWRSRSLRPTVSPEEEAAMVAEVKHVSELPMATAEDLEGLGPDDLRAATVQRTMKVQRGSFVTAPRHVLDSMAKKER